MQEYTCCSHSWEPYQHCYQAVASIAAIEAFRQMGGTKVYESLAVVMQEAGAIREANRADDTTDVDNDGIADVDQIPPHELAQLLL